MLARRRKSPQQLRLPFLVLLLLSFGATSVLAFLRHAPPSSCPNRASLSTRRMATTTDSASITARQRFPLLFPPSVRPTSLVFDDQRNKLWTFEQPFITTTNIKSRYFFPFLPTFPASLTTTPRTHPERKLHTSSLFYQRMSVFKSGTSIVIYSPIAATPECLDMVKAAAGGLPTHIIMQVKTRLLTYLLKC